MPELAYRIPAALLNVNCKVRCSHGHVQERVAESRWQVASAITLVNTAGKEVMKNLDSGVHLNDGNVTRNDLLDTIWV